MTYGHFNPHLPTEERPSPPPPCTADEALPLLLSKWESCFLGVYCSCGRSCIYPIKLLVSRRGDTVLEQAVSRMRCKTCRKHPIAIYLQETHFRKDVGAYRPGWSIDLLGAGAG